MQCSLLAPIQQIRLAGELCGLCALSTILIIADSEGALFAETVSPEAFNGGRATYGVSDRLKEGVE